MGATAGIIVGVLVGVLLVLLVLFVLYKRHRSDSKPVATNEFMIEEGFDNPTFIGADQDFVAGVNNPLYEWYQPDLTRNDASDQLMDLDAGSFVVRDSKATPGWHLLAVKTEGAILHEKIRRGDDGLYELLPSSGIPQPAFNSLPDLVHYYGAPREEADYTLNFNGFSNPMYDAVHQTDFSPVGPWMRDADAPAVPLKNREVDVVGQLATMDEDIYTNTQEAAQALSGRA
jgi:hypothetical protein